MLDRETFLLELYVLVDDSLAAHLPPDRHPGPRAGLARAELVTLALYGQWARFPSETAFWTHADRHLRGCFPGLPSRTRLNRLLRRAHDAIVWLGRYLADLLGAGDAAAYEVLDSTGVRTRNARRRGRGWLAGLATLGKCARLGWYHGFRLLLSVTPAGAITGFGFGPANTNDRRLAETLLRRRVDPDPRLPCVGRPAPSGDHLADRGFAGARWAARWRAAYGARVTCPPQAGWRARSWPPALHRWLAGRRQVIETVTDRLLTAFRLDAERPHTLDGFRTRLAAKVALHNAVIWFNRRTGRPDLAIADTIDWDAAPI